MRTRSVSVVVVVVVVVDINECSNKLDVNRQGRGATVTTACGYNESGGASVIASERGADAGAGWPGLDSGPICQYLHSNDPRSKQGKYADQTQTTDLLCTVLSTQTDCGGLESTPTAIVCLLFSSLRFAHRSHMTHVHLSTHLSTLSPPRHGASAQLGNLLR